MPLRNYMVSLGNSFSQSDISNTLCLPWLLSPTSPSSKTITTFVSSWRKHNCFSFMPPDLWLTYHLNPSIFPPVTIRRTSPLILAKITLPSTLDLIPLLLHFSLLTCLLVPSYQHLEMLKSPSTLKFFTWYTAHPILPSSLLPFSAESCSLPPVILQF